MPASGPSGQRRSEKFGRSIEGTFRDFWATRPVRPFAGRKLAGVAAAIGNRYAIDPTLVRVALVTLALFGGSGLVCYLLGWLFLAQQGDRHSAFGSLVGRGPGSTTPGFGVLLCIGLVVATGSMLSGNFLFGSTLAGPIGFAALLVGLYLLHTSRSDRLIEPQPPSPPASPAPAEGPTREAWDPLGAAPFTWELPDPDPQPPAPAARPRRRKSRVGLAGLAAALLALVACVLLVPVSGGWLTVPHILGVVLGVVGLTMVAGAFRGGGRSLILVAVLLTCASLVTMRGDAAGGFDTKYAPSSLAAVQPRYQDSWGRLALDLTRLPAKGSVHTSVENEFGSAVVRLPRDAEVTVSCHTEFGEARCLGERSRGLHGKRVRKHEAAPRGEGELHIQLDASTRFGSLEVRRG